MLSVQFAYEFCRNLLNYLHQFIILYLFIKQHFGLIHIRYKTFYMSVKLKPTASKVRTSSFQNNSKDVGQSRYGHSPDSRVDNRQNQEKYGIRFQRKDLRDFDPRVHITGQITLDDVVDLKEVFDAYDSTGMGVLLPNDLKLLLTQNGFQPNKKTIYEIVAQFDSQQTGGISFSQFMKAMGTKPYLNETKKQIGAIFKKYDRANKGYIVLDDLREINRHIKENLDDQTLKLMLERSDSNSDGKISFEDFYSVMVKSYY